MRVAGVLPGEYKPLDVRFAEPLNGEGRPEGGGLRVGESGLLGGRREWPREERE
jgi:hypothetical protein